MASDTLETNRIIEGDAFDVLTDLPAASVHAIVADPPYGLAFMGRSWDGFEPREYQEFSERWGRAAKRVLKPGGHLLAFSGSRTHHRLFSGVEDAGYEIRDTLTWHYGGGFPKALDVSKAIDKQADAEREVVGEYQGFDGCERDPDRWESDKLDGKYGGGETRKHQKDETGSGWGSEVTAPATDAAEQWDGFKTALKPATEFVVLARKPLSEGTVAENVTEHGTGALNIDATRIPTDEDTSRTVKQGGQEYSLDGDAGNFGYAEDKVTGGGGGRYPSNLVLDQEAAAMLDEQSGEAGDLVGYKNGNDPGDADLYGDGRQSGSRGYSDSGGASRFFYTSKASKSERTLDGAIENAHPTVKPVDLMTWLVTLATAEGQVVCDPFAGTGTTLRAAKDTGREFVGIEQDEQWVSVAQARCGLTPNDPSMLREDGEAGLEAFADGGIPE